MVVVKFSLAENFYHVEEYLTVSMSLLLYRWWDKQNKERELMKSVNVEPNWTNMFKAAEAQLKAQDFDGQAFVLEMFQFGMRCYEQQSQSPVWAVGEVGSINKDIRKGMEGMERKAEVE